MWERGARVTGRSPLLAGRAYTPLSTLYSVFAILQNCGQNYKEVSAG